MKNGIDFVESQPIFHLILVSGKDRADVALVKIDELVTLPSVVLLCKVERRLIVGNRDERFHAVLMAFIKKSVIKE